MCCSEQQGSYAHDSEIYAIEAAGFRIAGFASHNFWVLRDPEKEVIAELHGLSTNRKTGRILPLGTLGDRLGFYQFSAGFNHISLQGSNLLKNSQDFKIMYQGNKSDVLGRWHKAVIQLHFLNFRDINYSSFGIFGFPPVNSNSAFRKFATMMDISYCHFPGLWTPGINSLID